MLAKNNSDIEDAIVTFHELSDDEKIKLQCEARERYEWDMASAIAKGKEAGLREGKEAGLREGESLKLITLISKKLQRGKDILTIADELEEEPETIERICQVAREFAPDYDADKIYEKLKNSCA